VSDLVLTAIHRATLDLQIRPVDCVAPLARHLGNPDNAATMNEETYSLKRVVLWVTPCILTSGLKRKVEIPSL